MVGDLFGDLNSLENVFRVGGEIPDKKYLFLGNYIDRGRRGNEIV